MLQQLDIHNVALIDSVSIEFGQGLNVMTGETGAGKSIIIDSINAILGERVSKEIIRTGTDKATVEAVFQVDNKRLADIFEAAGIDAEEDGTLVLSREFTVSGRNICRVNGKMSTVSLLKEIGERIIDMHGQHDNQSLLRTSSHIDLLDSFGGEKIEKLKAEYRELLKNYKNIKSKLKELTGDKQERERKLDLLKFQINEIKKAKLKPGEEEDLNKQRILLSSSEKIIDALSKAYEQLYSGNNIKNSAHDNINEALKELSALTGIDEKYANISKNLEDIMYQLTDIVDEIRNERDSVEYDPAMLEQVEERLDSIFRLKKKYGSNIEEILSYLNKIEGELDEINGSEETVKKLDEEIAKVEAALYEKAQLLNNEREKASRILEEKIGGELNELEMKNARFKVELQFDAADRKFSLNGLDTVEFLISANAGEPLKPLSKIASGGEMSRVMLAIKTILADVDSVPVLIFDEIDIGISGKAAQKVGEKLSYISRSHQVICVTHLAQIGCMADSNYLIEKISTKDNTRTSVKKLGEKDTRNEIARIIGGANISDITLKNAEEMLSYAKQIKKNQVN